MKGITVNINRTVRQQVTVTANCEIFALPYTPKKEKER